MTISIIGLLVAIAVPGVQLASTHDSAQGVLPGWRNTIEAFPSKVSWTVKLLPFLGNPEAANWFDNYSGGDDITAKRLPLYVCPTAWYDVVRRSKSAAEPATSNASKSTHFFLLPKKLAAGNVAQPCTVYRVVNPVQGHPVTGDEAGSIWRFRFPSSPHPGDGACFVFCDGHTQFVSAKLDSWVYAQLMTSQQHRLSARAAGWEWYDHDEDPATEPVRYKF